MFCALGLAHPVTDGGSWYAQSTRLARRHRRRGCRGVYPGADRLPPAAVCPERSESTRLNSSHVAISYAVFCLKKKKKDFSVATSTTYAVATSYSVFYFHVSN